MYEIVTKGKEYEMFPTEVIKHFYKIISEEITSYLSKKKGEIEPVILGGMGFNQVTLKDGRAVNVWLEYNAKILAFGVVDAGIHKCAIYDGGIPDEILDSYNKVKEQIT
jgi:hypothetical protein